MKTSVKAATTGKEEEERKRDKFQQKEEGKKCQKSIH
jgi:hypothetical protein